MILNTLQSANKT